MKPAIISLILSSLLFAGTIKVKTGLEVLRDRDFDLLKGKRVGLITNPTGVDRDLNSTIDIFHSEIHFQLTALFGPEHGVRGDHSAGSSISNYTDPTSGIIVYSLYGATRKPSADMLQNIDVLVYDIQDIGCRSYTYISTMGLAMEAAAENHLPFIVLDRPNPLGGNRIEGNIVEDGYYSFVSQFPIPYVYGLTAGELAKFLNEEHLLKNGIKCDLTVVPMEGWTRDMTFNDTGLPWVLTSPHIPSAETALYYVATGILGELGVISEGVGSTLPFQIFAAEWINGTELADKMKDQNIPGVRFRPITIKHNYGSHKDSTLQGVQIYFTDYAKCPLMKLQFIFMEVHNKMYPEHNPFTACKKDRLSMFDKVCGTKTIREKFTENMEYQSISSYLTKDENSFREKIKPYLLY